MWMLLLALIQPALAHDYFLEVQPSAIAVGGKAKVYGIVAHETERDVRGQRPDTLSRLDASAGGTVTAVAPAPALRGAPTYWGLLPATAPGVVAVAYANTGSEVSLPHERFVRYVAGEGDDRKIEVAKGLSGDQVERYRRSLKALLRVGDDTTGWDAVLGLPLELVPQSDPFARPASGELSLQLLEDGQPQAGVKVRAFPAVGHAQAEAVTGRTDAEGKVSLAMPAREGGWVVAAVTMTHEAGREHPWHSLWTTLRLP